MSVFITLKGHSFLSHLLVAGCDMDDRFSIRLSVCLSIFMSKFHIYVKVSILIDYKTKQPPNLAWNISPTSWLGRYLDLVTLTYISRSSDFDTIYVDVPDLLNCKAFNHQTLNSASPRCTDSAGALTPWSWPIFCTPVTLTHFYVDVRYLLNYKTYNHQTLHNASPHVRTLRVPWPVI